MPLSLFRTRRAPVRLAALIVAGLLVLWLVAVDDQGDRIADNNSPPTPAVYRGPSSARVETTLGNLARFFAALPSPSAEPNARARSDGSGGISSTAYCLTGRMANGETARVGAVAANRWPLGTRLRVTPSPVGEIVVVADRIGSGSELDFALPGDCGAARAWGRRTVTVEVLA